MSADHNVYADPTSGVHPILAQQSPQYSHSNLQAAQQLQTASHPTYPSTIPSTPLNTASPASAASPAINISPEALANLTSAVQAGSPFSAANSVISPTGSTFSTGVRSDLSGTGSAEGSAYGMSAALALANAVGMNGAGGANLGASQALAGSSQGMQGGQAIAGAGQLVSDVDLTFPTPPQSGPSSTGTSTPAIPPPSAFYYSTSSTSLASQISQSSLPPPSHPAPTLAPPPRHHPYAHPSRPSLSASQTQASVPPLPLYLSTPSPAAHSGTPPPLSASSETPTNFGLGLPPASPVAPQRVHSAPAHILTLKTQGLDNLAGSPLASANSEAPPSAAESHRFFSDFSHAEDETMLITPLQQGAGMSAAPMSSTPTALGPAFGGGMSFESLQQQQPALPVRPSTANSTLADDRMRGYNDQVSAAILLLQKRLPIMEAALSTSAKESGNDEEEIWKGIEGAYEELKRIMGDRRSMRRHSLGASTSVAGSKRPFSTMELESPATPVTPVDPERSQSAFIANHPPPLLHSLSTPDVPLSAQAAAARQAAAAHAQTAQLHQQAQLQQAQLQAQAQAEAHARAQAQLQAEADRARAEVAQRARAEEDMRAQMEAEARARADAEAEAAQQQQRAEQARREAEQYQQMLHEDQLRVARERLHQQMQEVSAGVPQNLPNPPVPPQALSMPQPTLLPPSQQAPPPQQLANGQLLFATPQQAQAYAMQLQTSSALGGNGPITLVPVLPLPPGGVALQQQSQNLNLSGPPSVSPNHLAQGFNPANGSDTALLQLPNHAYAPAPPPHQSQPDSIDPSAFSVGLPPATVSPPTLTAPTFAAAPQATTGPVRPARSRAASQSGYASSGSRSRAASGSGYQTLLESRSRAASSASSVYQSFERDEDEDGDEEGADLDHDIDVSGDGPARAKTSSQMGAASAGVEPDLKVKMDPVFLEFLADICSNLEATDLKGEPIHQTLMAKKMEKLDQSHDFRPFKFRIQAFTTAFAERVAQSAVFEHEVPVKKIRQYLWAQPYISRFNDDGKKAKSKGNHIWTVEAKKIPDKKWIFREFARCIKGVAPPVAFIGMPWAWAPRVWDPQCSSAAIDASFMSPSLPAWLSWEDNILSGEVPQSAHGQTVEVEAVATFQMGNRVNQLRATIKFLVASPNETDDPAAFAAVAAGTIRLRDHQLDEEIKPHLSGDSSRRSSPEASVSSLNRSQDLGNSGVFETATNGHFLPATVNGSGGSHSGLSGLGTPGSALEAAFAPLPSQSLSDSVWPAIRNDEQLDMEVDGASLEMQQQAALHQHYAALASAEGQPFDGAPPNAFSFAAPPAAVMSALENVASGYNSAFTSINPGVLSNGPSETGTPGGVFQMHDISRQPPFTSTLDPSTL
ncbi:hypothetical protein JCM11641_003692 [Rhodosporidiobolus odoratus]